MARMRTLKPGFFTSEDVTKYTFRARLLWAGLWTYCDDHGRGKDNVRLIKAEVWPLDDDVELGDIEADLAQLQRGGAIVRYRVSGVTYLAVQNWHYHQKPNHPTETKLPDPPVPIAVPAPGEKGHCAACWKVYTRLTEPSLIPPDAFHESETGYPQSAGHEFTEDSGSPTVHVRVGGGGEKEREKEGRGSARDRATNPPPPGSRPRCSRHARLPDDDPGPNCVGCRDARLAAEHAAAQPPPMPEWCGRCDQNTRQYERDDGRVSRCRTCHPLRSVG